MKNAIERFYGMIQKRPLSFALLFGLCTSLGTALALRPDWELALMAIAILALVSYAVIFWRIVAILVLALGLPAIGSDEEARPEKTEDFAPIVIGGAVLAVGAGVAYWMYRFCQKHFPPPPPPPPTNSIPTNIVFKSESPVSGFALNSARGSCPQDDPESPEYVAPGEQVTTSHLYITVGQQGSITTSILSLRGQSCTFAEKQEEMAAAGLSVTGDGGPPTYSTDGAPSSGPGAVQWLAEERAIRYQRTGAALYRVTVSRSRTMQVWQPLMNFDLEPGTRLTFSDTEPESVVFYKVESKLID